MQNTIIVPQRLTYKEFLDAMLYVCALSRRLRRYFMFMLILMGSSQLLGFITSPHHAFGVWEFLNMLMILGGMALAGIIVLVIITFLIYQTKPDLFNNVSYQFSHWGITRDGKGTSFSKPWREIDRFKESKQFFLLYVSVFDVHIIQKKMIGDVERINIFRSMLEENVGKG